MSKLSDTLRGLAVELGAESPLAEDTGQSRAGAEHEYALFTSANRIYAQDATGKVIALGDLFESEHIYRYELDEGEIRGDGLPDLGSALRDLSAHLTFAYLDGLFRSQIDVADEASLHSVSVPAIRVRLAPGAV
ncbi:hypothetical protein [Bordetella sp. LUAb4]|uniref:hypothetical protein n=1 Tax=Bordetella sp. LUAb4 TaxID=2843195 RepID=UPI001E491EF3|nr:hypothetical protein [Bordetella sp. LUAb4]